MASAFSFCASSENGAPASSRAGFIARPAREDAGAPPDFHCFRASQRDINDSSEEYREWGVGNNFLVPHSRFSIPRSRYSHFFFLFDETLAFFDRQEFVRIHVSYLVDHAAGPADFNEV